MHAFIVDNEATRLGSALFDPHWKRPMHRFETIDLGTYRGNDYFLIGFVDPQPPTGADSDPDDDADAYGVALARSTAFGSNVEIVRMDTAHGRSHLDLLYLPLDADTNRKVWLAEGYTYERMKRYLLANWRQFVDSSLRYADRREDG